MLRLRELQYSKLLRQQSSLVDLKMSMACSLAARICGPLRLFLRLKETLKNLCSQAIMPLHGTWKSLHHSEMTEAKKFNLDDGIFKTVTLPLVAEKRWRRGFTPARASFGNWLPLYAEENGPGFYLTWHATRM